MGNGAAAQHADFDRVVEQHKIEGGLQRRGRAIVLGIEEFGIEQSNVADFALALRFRLAEIDHAGLAKFGDPLQRFPLRLEHGVDEMHATALIREHLRDEQALLQLAAEFGALLHERTFRDDLFTARQQRRIAARQRH